MNKRVLLTTLCVALIAIIGVFGTVAYFTDTDDAANVMTTGKVDIIQNENGEAGFEQNQALMPMVDNRAEGDAIVVDGMFNENMLNVVDKVVTVTNEAAEGAVNQDAYVRTLIAFETATEYAEDTDTVLRDGAEIFDTYIGVLGKGLVYTDITFTIDGTEYILAYKVYEKALAPQEESEPSLKQVFLSPDANNEVVTLFGEEYTILTLSQACQTAGFDTAAEALDTAFGPINAETAAAWFAEVK